MISCCPTVTFITEHAFDDFSRWFDSSNPPLGSGWVVESYDDSSDEFFSIRKYVSSCGASIRISTTRIFDSVELFGVDEVVLSAVRGLMLEHVSGALDSRFRGVAEFRESEIGSSKRAILHATYEDALVGAGLGQVAGGKLLVVLSKSILAGKFLERRKLVCESESVLVAEISDFDTEVFEYVFGAVSDPPPVIVGALEAGASAQELCNSLSENLVHRGTLLDSGVTHLIAPAMRYLSWGFLLNIGDKGYENSAIAFVGRDNSSAETALSRSFKYRASVLIGDKCSGHLLPLTLPASE